MVLFDIYRSSFVFLIIGIESHLYLLKKQNTTSAFPGWETFDFGGAGGVPPTSRGLMKQTSVEMVGMFKQRNEHYSS